MLLLHPPSSFCVRVFLPSLSDCRASWGQPAFGTCFLTSTNRKKTFLPTGGNLLFEAWFVFPQQRDSLPAGWCPWSNTWCWAGSLDPAGVGRILDVTLGQECEGVCAASGGFNDGRGQGACQGCVIGLGLSQGFQVCQGFCLSQGSAFSEGAGGDPVAGEAVSCLANTGGLKGWAWWPPLSFAVEGQGAGLR